MKLCGLVLKPSETCTVFSHHIAKLPRDRNYLQQRNTSLQSSTSSESALRDVFTCSLVIADGLSFFMLTQIFSLAAQHGGLLGGVHFILHHA